jgi:uncharacterized protein YpmS
MILSRLFIASVFVVAVPFAHAIEVLEPVRDWRTSLPEITQGNEAAEVQVRNSTLLLNPGTAFQFSELHATLEPRGDAKSVDVNDFNSYEVNIEHARVRIKDKVLQQLVQAELERTDSPLRIDSVQTTASVISIKGAIRRLGFWVPFSMEGTPKVSSDSEISLTPNKMKVAGIPVYKALLATNIQLQALIDMPSKAVSLEGQGMVLRVQPLISAPRLQFSLANVSLDAGHVELTMARSTRKPVAFCKQACPDSFMYTEGGQINAAGVRLSGKPALLTGSATGTLTVPLHNVAQVLQTSLLWLRQDGAIWISAREGTLSQAQQTLFDRGAVELESLQKHLPAVGEGEPEVTLAVHHASMQTQEGVEIRIEKLLATTNSTKLADLPVSEQNVAVAEIGISEQSLAVFMNKVLFAYEDSPIAKVQPTIETEQITLRLKAKPSFWGFSLFWVPVKLTGQLVISDKRDALQFRPGNVFVFGMPMKKTMDFLGIELDDILTIDRPAVQLQGNVIEIALLQALPPLTLKSQLQVVSLVPNDPNGGYVALKLGSFDQIRTVAILDAMERLPLGLWVSSPEFTALGMNTGKTLGHLLSHDPENQVYIRLKEYPALLEQARIRMPQPGRVWVELPSDSKHKIQSNRHKHETHEVADHHQ